MSSSAELSPAAASPAASTSPSPSRGGGPPPVPGGAASGGGSSGSPMSQLPKGRTKSRRKISLPWFRQSSFGMSLSRLRLPKQHTIATSDEADARPPPATVVTGVEPALKDLVRLLTVGFPRYLMLHTHTFARGCY